MLELDPAKRKTANELLCTLSPRSPEGPPEDPPGPDPTKSAHELEALVDSAPFMAPLLVAGLAWTAQTTASGGRIKLCGCNVGGAAETTAAQYLLDLLRRVPGNSGFRARYDVSKTVLCHSRLRANALLAIASDGAKYAKPPFSSKRDEAMAKGSARDQRERRAAYDRVFGADGYGSLCDASQGLARNTRVLLAFHATTSEEVAQAVLQGNFGNLQKLDDGYFGKGIYFTLDAEYAIEAYGRELFEQYDAVPLLVSVIVVSGALPVIELPDPSDPTSYLGQPLVGGADSHVAVVAKDDRGEFVPCPSAQWSSEGVSTYTEFVLRHEAQVLPLGYMMVKCKAAPPSSPLLNAAKVAYERFYKFEYDEPLPGAPDAFWDDIGYPHDDREPAVPRPNHGLANAIRKALLVEPVAAALCASHGSAFAFDPAMVEAMQVAMIFATCGRRSDIGGSVDPTAYSSYRQASRAAYEAYAGEVGITEDHRRKCLEALRTMYGKDPAGPGARTVKTVLEMCHDLDLLRCVPGPAMEAKLVGIADQVGALPAKQLAERAERAIRATGDRVMHSPTHKRLRGYHTPSFRLCSVDAVACMERAGGLHRARDDAPPPPPPPLPIKAPSKEGKGEAVARRLEAAVASSEVDELEAALKAAAPHVGEEVSFELLQRGFSHLEELRKPQPAPVATPAPVPPPLLPQPDPAPVAPPLLPQPDPALPDPMPIPAVTNTQVDALLKKVGMSLDELRLATELNWGCRELTGNHGKVFAQLLASGAMAALTKIE